MTSTLSCPKCGAPAADGPNATRCDYCGSALATIACPSCFNSMFVGMQFCPHCGAKSGQELVDDDSKPLPCPGCKTPMHLVRVGATPMRECPSCASNWLDTETFTTLCTNREERGSVASIVGSTVASEKPQLGGSIRYLPCPVCAKLMNRINFGQRSGVIIDVCKGHGTWFEPRELHSVLAFIDSGAFERARVENTKRATEEQRMRQSPVFQVGGAAGGSGFVTHDDDSPAVDDSFLRSLLDQLLS